MNIRTKSIIVATLALFTLIGAPSSAQARTLAPGFTACKWTDNQPSSTVKHGSSIDFTVTCPHLEPLEDGFINWSIQWSAGQNSGIKSAPGTHNWILPNVSKGTRSAVLTLIWRYRCTKASGGWAYIPMTTNPQIYAIY